MEGFDVDKGLNISQYVGSVINTHWILTMLYIVISIRRPEDLLLLLWTLVDLGATLGLDKCYINIMFAMVMLFSKESLR